MNPKINFGAITFYKDELLPVGTVRCSLDVYETLKNLYGEQQESTFVYRYPHGADHPFDPSHVDCPGCRVEKGTSNAPDR